MRQAAVMKAMHSDKHPNAIWPGDRVGWQYGSEKDDIALLFPQFFEQAPDWKILVVSGDADSAVPFEANHLQNSIEYSSTYSTAQPILSFREHFVG